MEVLEIDGKLLPAVDGKQVDAHEMLEDPAGQP